MTTTITLKPIHRTTVTRAEDSDPNFRRCLIENCSTNQAIHVAHVFDREVTAIPRFLESLEWNWNMIRETLNLDTRSNIFFLGASMHQLYQEMKWILLPEKDVVLRFFHEDRFPLKRPEFPEVEASPESEVFRYIFVPVRDMEDICITRQSMDENDKRLIIHKYPFDNFPIITSHIHPKYAILQAGKAIRRGLGWQDKKSLISRYPWLEKAERLYLTWTSFLHHGAEVDPVFNSLRRTEGNHDVSPDSISLGNTPPLRIQALGLSDTPQSSLAPASNTSSDYLSRTTAVHAPVRKTNRRKRSADDNGDSPRPKKRQQLTSAALHVQAESEGLYTAEWTSDRVLSWAQRCRFPSPVPVSVPALAHAPSRPPPSTTNPPLRRSERLKAKLRKS
ncbi:hypothetical protein BJ165DRAFT_1597304 [Panaeolus papilionaceus]|nr:hypothetical protein BJ165DRAFT_1597304 [Panaeolus papilionaceus]